jgi:hypothetical protein
MIAILILTRSINRSSQLLYKNISQSSSHFGNTYFLLHDNSGHVNSTVKRFRTARFSDSIINELGYIPISNSLIPGSNHFPLLKFYKDNPKYKYYWLIEDDVRFSGDWSLIFNTFSKNQNHDLITSNIRHFEEQPDWYWWNSLTHENYKVPIEKRIRSFNPIYRISNEALQYTDDLLVKGWRGHHEVLFPTLIQLGGGKLLDFGGSGSFVPNDFCNRFYTSDSDDVGGLSKGTMRYRPIMKRRGKMANKLYHPVKHGLNQ